LEEGAIEDLAGLLVVVPAVKFDVDDGTAGTISTAKERGIESH
jgi:hypothetical protein